MSKRFTVILACMFVMLSAIVVGCAEKKDTVPPPDKQVVQKGAVALIIHRPGEYSVLIRAEADTSAMTPKHYEVDADSVFIYPRGKPGVLETWRDKGWGYILNRIDVTLPNPPQIVGGGWRKVIRQTPPDQTRVEYGESVMITGKP